MYEDEAVYLRLEYDKLLQEYQVIFGVLYSIPLGFIITILTSQGANYSFPVLFSLGVIFWLISQKKAETETNLKFIRERLVEIEKMKHGKSKH